MLLFEAKATDIQMTRRLQYLSNALQIYYCNTLALAKIHAKAMEFLDNCVQSNITIEEIIDDF